MTDQNSHIPENVPPVAPPSAGYAPPPSVTSAYPQPPPTGLARRSRPSGSGLSGQDVGIVGLILAFVMQLAGLICCIIALNQSKRAGFKNTPAFIGLILNIVFIVLSIVAVVIVFAVLVPTVYTACTTGQVDCS